MLHQLIVYLIAFYCITKCCRRAQQPTLMLSIEIHNIYIVRQIYSAHAQPLLRNNFLASTPWRLRISLASERMWCLAKTTEPLDTGAAETKKS